VWVGIEETIKRLPALCRTRTIRTADIMSRIKSQALALSDPGPIIIPEVCLRLFFGVSDSSFFLQMLKKTERPNSMVSFTNEVAQPDDKCADQNEEEFSSEEELEDSEGEVLVVKCRSKTINRCACDIFMNVFI